MAECTTCNVCDEHGALAEERQRVPCNVRTFKDDTFTVWRCTGCKSLHSAEDADLGYYYSAYPPHKVDASKLNFVTRIGCRHRANILIRQGLKKTDRILDYGCGGGLFLQFLKEEGFSNVAGYDAYVPAYADKRILEERYDAIVSWDVIEHTDEPRDFFRSLTGLLRPGGLLTIGTPNAEHISLGKEPLSTPELHQPYHRHILSEAALLRFGHENGLTASHRSHRLYMDSLFPFINTQFIWGYTVETGGFIDVVGEPPRFDVFFRSPSLLAKAFFGYFFPNRANMIISFRNTSSTSSTHSESC